MCKRLVTPLVLVGVIATFVVMQGTEAWAGTCSLSKCTGCYCCGYTTSKTTGQKICSLWCTGSEICSNVINGLGGNIVNDCIPGETCPTTECSAFGTVPTDTSAGTCNESLDILNETCGIAGVAVCSNPNGHFNAQGTPYTLSGAEHAIGDVQTCDKKGKCTNSLTLEPSDTSNICINPNWNFVTFTAGTFKAKSCLCPGGYDNETPKKCCATASRTTDGKCSDDDSNVYAADSPLTRGTSTCVTAFCTVDLTNYTPNSPSLAYDCQPVTTPTCGGITNIPCPVCGGPDEPCP